MKQWMKNIAAGVIAAVISVTMIGSNAISVSAEETNYPADSTNCSITINNVSGVHTYEAYQIFSGDVYETTQDGTTTRVLSNVDWGDSLHVGQNLKNKTLIQHLQDQDALKSTAISNLTYSQASDQVSSSPSEVLDAIKSAVGDQQDTEKAQAVAKVFFHTIDSSPASTPSGTGSNQQDSSQTIKISGLKPGYYIVIDKDGSQSGNIENGSFTSVILQVVGQETITPKSDVPTLSKKVWNSNKSGGAGWDDYTFAGTGDTINYKLTGTLPSNFDNFYTYVTYTISDELPVGITIDSDNVKVYAGSEDLSAKEIGTDSGYTDITSLFTVSVTNPTEYDGSAVGGFLDVLLNENSQSVRTKKDLRSTDVYNFTPDTKIIVLYTGKLNKYAETGQGKATTTDNEYYDFGKGNKNVASLIYSNNPNMTYSYSDDSTGATPEVSATVFTFKFEPTKYHDRVMTGNEQSGAMFTLYKAVNSEGSYTKDEINGIFGFGVSGNDGKITFYKAATSNNRPESGDYSTVKKADGSTYYVYKDSVETDGESSGEEEDSYVKGSGELKLAPGTYILSETTTPAGYNTMQDITMTVSATVDTTNGEPSLSNVTVDTNPKIRNESGQDVSSFNMKSTDLNTESEDNGIIVGNIINTAGSLLPNTGGIGTTIFYIVGGVIILGAIILLVARRKKDE